jgi:hypothetical protein
MLVHAILVTTTYQAATSRRRAAAGPSHPAAAPAPATAPGRRAVTGSRRWPGRAEHRRPRAAGPVVAFAIDDLEGDLTRLEDADGRIPVPPATWARGERAVQVRERGGAMVALLDWNAPAGD